MPDTTVVPSRFDTIFTWEYAETKPGLLDLYRRAKKEQWNAETDLDWSLDVDPEREYVPDSAISIYGSPVWERLTPREIVQVRRESSAWLVSQFLHGEQGALLATAKLAMSVPWADAKLFTGTQIADEARHVEVYARYLREKVGRRYPINSNLKLLLDQILTDSRWDLTYLGMQILVEGLALAAFGLIYRMTTEPLMKEITRRVMADEARHVAFGVLSLAGVYEEMGAAERADREEFAVEACRLMHNRLMGEEVWQACGFPVDECRDYARTAPVMREFRRLLFSKVMPNLRKLGLITERVGPAYAELGILSYQQQDPSA